MNIYKYLVFGYIGAGLLYFFWTLYDTYKTEREIRLGDVFDAMACGVAMPAIVLTFVFEYLSDLEIADRILFKRTDD